MTMGTAMVASTNVRVTAFIVCNQRVLPALLLLPWVMSASEN